MASSVARGEAYERFGPFLIVRALGRGGMGEVYVARTPWDHAPLAAVKRLRPDVARVPTFAERFKHEADLSVRLDHPNVVGTIDVGSVGTQLYVASRLILGKDTAIIADRLRERGLGAPLAVVIRLLSDILAGLSYVHGAREPNGKWLGLVHRDVTPGNVLLGFDGVARLADFGLAKSALVEGGKLTGHGEILGTPHYLAPEIIRGGRASPASDIYGLGAVMYRVLTGVPPHQGTTAEVLFKALNERPRNLSELRPDLPEWFVKLVHRMLEPVVKQRPSDAALLARELDHQARRDKLVLQPESVGKWLDQLFDKEHREEEAEYARLIAMDPDLYPEGVEGTVVLARIRPGSELRAPPSPGASADEAGTELETSGSSAPEVQPKPYDEDAAEDIRTWALPFHREGSHPSDSFRDDEGTLFDARAAQGEAPAASRPRVASRAEESIPSLPGFADGSGSSEAGEVSVEEMPRTQVRSSQLRDDDLEPRVIAGNGAQLRQRPRNPDSVVVGPAPGRGPNLAKGAVVPQSPMESRPAEEPSRPQRREPKKPEEPGRSPRPPSESGPRQDPSEPMVTALRGPQGVVFALLALLLIGAGALGGVLVSRLLETEPALVSPEPSPPVVEAPKVESSPVRQRLRELRQELASRSVQPEGAARLVADAQEALLDGNSARAQELVAELERLLRTPLEPD